MAKAAAVSTTFDTSDFRRVAAQLAKVRPALVKQLKSKVGQAASDVADLARTNASWSTKIPPAIHATKATVSGTLVSARVTVKGTDPSWFAEAWETGRTGEGNPWRHPLFGNKRHWYDEYGEGAARPFMAPAAKQGQEGTHALVQEGVDAALREAGVSDG